MRHDRLLPRKKLACALIVTGVILLATINACCICSSLVGIGDDDDGNLLIKLDGDGHLLWSKFYKHSYPDVLAGTVDGGALIIGYPPGSWISKLDSNGELQWDKVDYKALMYPIITLEQVSNGSFIIDLNAQSLVMIGNDGSPIWRNNATPARMLHISSLAASDDSIVAATDSAVGWLDSDGNITGMVDLSHRSDMRPLLHVIDGGDCIVAYSAALDNSEAMYVARLNRTGYIWEMTVENSVPVSLCELPGGRLCAVYGKAADIKGNPRWYDGANSNKLPLTVRSLSYDGAPGPEQIIGVKLPYLVTGDGDFVYAAFTSGANEELVRDPGVHESLPDVRVVRLDMAGDERWNATVELGDAWYADLPGKITRNVESITQTGDGGYIVQVDVRGIP